MDFGNFERNLWKFLTLGVTATVLGNIIMNPKGLVDITKASGEVYLGVLKELRR